MAKMDFYLHLPPQHKRGYIYNIIPGSCVVPLIVVLGGFSTSIIIVVWFLGNYLLGFWGGARYCLTGTFAYIYRHYYCVSMSRYTLTYYLSTLHRQW